MDLNCKIWEVSQGQVTKIKINDLIYNLRQEQETGEFREKGNIIDTVSNVSIYKNVLEDVAQELITKPNPDVVNVLKNFFDMKTSSLTKYEWGYKKYLSLNDDRFRDIVKPRKQQKVNPELGEVVHQYNHNSVYQNVLDDFRDAIKNNRSVNKVLKSYFPKHKRSTLKTYISLYKRYLREFENTQTTLIPTNNKNNGRRRKHSQRPPSDAYGFDSTYGTWVLNDEKEMIKRMLNKVEFNYKPTVTELEKRTGLKPQRIRACLHLLMKEDKVGFRYEDLTPIYMWKSTTHP